MRLPRSLAVAGSLVTVLALAGCGSDGDDTARESTDSPSPTASSSGPVECDYPSDGQEPARAAEAPPVEPSVSGEVPVLIATSSGKLSATLDADATPCTVNSFVSLAGQAYYDNTPCHRLTTEGIFVLQCGDPTGTGMGGPGYTIADELSGAETYEAGTIAMAKTSAPDSGGSQFFLVYDDTALPADYTVFGHLDEAGLKTLRKIAKKGTLDGGPDGAPAKPVFVTRVTFDD